MEPTITTDFLYHYVAKVIRVYDGDTITVNIDLGLHTWITDENIRFARIDAPEIRGEEREKGLKSRDFLRSLIMEKDILLITLKDKEGKYGRYIGEIWVETQEGYKNVNDIMVQGGYAEYATY